VEGETVSTYEDISQSRRLVVIGIVLGYAGAVILTIVRILNTDVMTVGELLGSIALGAALALPATLALLSLDGRPTLLPGAIITTLVPCLVVIELAPIWLVIAFVWYRAWTKRPVRAEVSTLRGAARVGLGFLMAASILALFIHVDPVCSQRLADGTSRSVDAASRGYATGWAFGNGTTSSTGFEASGSDVVAETCSSDTIVLGEALLSLLITGLAVEVGRRWPRGVTVGEERRDADAAAP
jgi:hypothetical protein